MDVALLRSRASGFDVVNLADACKWKPRDIGRLFYDIGGRFKIDRIRAAMISTHSDSHWERLALRHLEEDFFKAQSRFTQHAAQWHKKRKGKPSSASSEIISDWIKDNIPQIKTYEDTVQSMTRSGSWTVSKFAIVNAQLSDLLSGL